MDYTIIGQLVGGDRQQSLANLDVEASYRQQGRVLKTDRVRTDTKGGFKLRFPDTLLANATPAQALEVVFQVYRDGQPLPARGGIARLQAKDYKVRIEVTGEAPAGHDAPAQNDVCRVHGVITWPTNKPAVNLTVRAFDRDLRTEQLLGEARTDAKGGYEIRYTNAQFRRAEKESADLLVRAYDGQGAQLGESRIFFNAGRDAQIDLEVQVPAKAVLSEFEELVRELTPLLEGVGFAELTEDDKHHDISFLANESGRDARLISQLAAAHRFAEKTQIAPEVFYGLLRQELPQELTALLDVKPSRWRSALQAAIDRNIVSQRLRDELDKILARLTDLAVEQAFVGPESGQAAPLGLAAKSSGASPAVQRAFVRFARSYEEDGNFWEAFSRQPGVSAADMGELRFAMESSSFVFGHEPALVALQKLRRKAGVKTVRELALRMSRADFKRVVSASSTEGLPSTFNSDDAFADAIANRVEAAYPTAVVANRIASIPELGSTALARFFETHDDFDLFSSSIDTFLAKSGRLDTGIDRAALAQSLKQLQRTAFIAPPLRRADMVVALLQHNFASALHVQYVGEEEFRRVMEPVVGHEVAGEIVSRVLARLDTLFLFAMQLRDQMVDLVAVIPGLRSKREAYTAVSPQIKTLTDMFGTLNGCRCEHCSSMYSATAYLVDLLEYLRSTPSPGEGMLGSSWLLKNLSNRRPDIWHIELNCANATMLVPYIDLVNEILEGAVVGSTTVDWGLYQTPEREASEPKEEYEARMLAEPLRTNREAYNLLRGAKYPWMLPFDADEERAVALAEHLRLDWAEVYRLFGRGDAALARAELGLRSHEWELLTSPATATVSGRPGRSNVHPLWGVETSKLNVASTFARQAGLTADEVFALMESWFLSEKDLTGVTISLREGAGTDPCDFDDYVIGNLNDEVLDQVHRFLRLRRRLGWSVNDLDAVLKALSSKTIDRSSLTDVARVLRVARQYGRKVDQLVRMPAVDLPRWMGISDPEITLFVELNGLTDPRVNNLADPRNRGRRPRLELLERWLDFRDLGSDVRELSYLLLGRDELSPVFAPLPEDTRAYLIELHGFIQAQLAAGTLPGVNDREHVGVVSGLLIDNLASRLGIDASVCERLVGRLSFDEQGGLEVESITALVRVGAAPGAPAISVFRQFVNIVATAVTPDAADPATYEDAALMLLRLDRVARLLRGLELSRPRLDVVVATLSENGFLDFNLIGNAGSPQPRNLDLYNGWLMLAKASATRVMLERSRIDLFALMSAATDATIEDARFFASLASATGWNRDVVSGATTTTITVILAAMGQQVTQQHAAFRKAETFSRIHAIVQWMRSWRVDASTLAGWSDPNLPSEDLANSLQKAVQARQSSNASWYAVLRPINDRLREARREALLGYLLAYGAPIPASRSRWKFNDSAEVYAWYLIDPEMSACMQTSRIVQASASIQLLIQRVLQKLEDVPMLDESKADAWHRHWQRWPAMKNYRVWEANRKVFFYPENWLFPDLRDDKSPFFAELENALQQDKVDDASVSRAYRDYLGKLHEVANLNIRGFYIDEKYNTDNVSDPGRKLIKQVMHIFARTHSEPHVYFYRRRDLISGVWTAWEKVELNIEGDHLVPVVHNGELLLFWAQLRGKGSVGEEREFSRYELGLAYSRFRDGKWKAPKTGSQSFSFPADKRPSLTLRTWVATTEPLRIVVFFDNEAQNSYVFDACRESFELDSVSRAWIYYPPQVESSGTLFVETATTTDSPLSIPSGPVGAYNYGGYIQTQNILSSTPSKFNLVPDTQFAQLDGERPFFFQDLERSFLVQPEFEYFDGSFLGITRIRMQRFELAYHSYLCEIVERFETAGFTGLLAPPKYLPQRRNGSAALRDPFDRQNGSTWPSPLQSYAPEPWVLKPYPAEAIDFELTAAYANYNWELFFHIPLLVATRLSQAQQFEDAQRWFHYIFDPTDTSPHPPIARVWRVKPFFDLALEPPTTLAELLEKIARRDADAIEQVHVWRNDPFNPHAIARLRHVAYMKAVVMAYLDNLIAWADDLFRQFTRETTNEAANLYLLAMEIMGPRPVQIRAQEPRGSMSYTDLIRGATFDEIGNPWLDLDTMLLIDTGNSPGSTAPRPMPYFCLTPNDKLLAYWDTVADRLFKIRHCMDIEGRLRALPLFEPPIDPALLVRARAAGVDLRSALRGSSEVPNYRFAVMHQKALEFCGEVRNLGAAVLAALEKRDAEALGLLRSTHEMNLLGAMTEIRTRQVDEARETIASLTKGKEIAETRLEFYRSREFMIAGEITAMALEGSAAVLNTIGQGFAVAAASVHLVPQIKAQAMCSGSETGGQQVGDSLAGNAEAMRFLGGIASYGASLASTLGGYQRRQDDWDHQANLAEREIAQADRQIVAAEIRLAIAEKELDNHRQQIAQAQEVDDYLRSKFTNRQLYDWMAGQLSGLHYQAYQLALDMAFKAQAAANFELGYTSSNTDVLAIISFQHSDPGYRRLTAGESLAHELRRLDAAYLERNVRRFEITKHVSLAALDPGALITLKATGSADFTLPEWLFDLDYPGHFNRRIKSVSVTIPCVAGPYASVNCTLALEGSKIRYSTDLDLVPANVGLGHSGRIATSSAQNDSGMFELNFRDERYLPFEGAGVVESHWQIQLGGKWKSDGTIVDLASFDFETISDVVLSISYTAQDGGEVLRSEALSRLQRELNSTQLARGFSLRHEFPSQWNALFDPPTGTGTQAASFPLTKERFPLLVQRKQIDIQEMTIYLVIDPDDADVDMTTLGLTFGSAVAGSSRSPIPLSDNDGVILGTYPPGPGSSSVEPGDWVLSLVLTEGGPVPREALRDIVIVCHYTVGN